MPLLYACRCGVELSLHFDDKHPGDFGRVEGYGYSLDDVFNYLKCRAELAHDVVDLNGEVLAAGVCRATYERTGECNLCGECCKYVYQSISEAEATDPDHSRWLALRAGRVDHTSYGAWDVLPHPCQSLAEEGPQRLVCGCYTDRPDMCKRWPEHPWDIEPYPKCGYKFSLKQRMSV